MKLRRAQWLAAMLHLLSHGFTRVKQVLSRLRAFRKRPSTTHPLRPQHAAPPPAWRTAWASCLHRCRTRGGHLYATAHAWKARVAHRWWNLPPRWRVALVGLAGLLALGICFRSFWERYSPPPAPPARVQEPIPPLHPEADATPPHPVPPSPAPSNTRQVVVVKDDIRSSFLAAGFPESFFPQLASAFASRSLLSKVAPGDRFRVITEELPSKGDGPPALDLRALEYLPAEAARASLRLFAFSIGRGKAQKKGYYDAKGARPIPGLWRYPVTFGRISSRFHPRRIHPVLHVRAPHNGVDFAAPSGTPIHVASPGVVLSVGPGGSCGNRVEVSHARGLVSIYCHLSRFERSLRPGKRLAMRQVLGYVGQTGRATGPHLHLAVKRGPRFVDPLPLFGSGVQVLSREERRLFTPLRDKLHAILDAIPLPSLPTPEPLAETLDLEE